VNQARPTAGYSSKGSDCDKQDLGRKFIDWLFSPRGQVVIAAYKIDGARLFFPNAGSDS
jgi:ABC-type tungstate transport system permease subunit